MARRATRREPTITHIYPLLSYTDYCGLLTKLIGITSENLDGAKRTRIPLHTMKGQNCLFPITIKRVRDHN